MEKQENTKPKGCGFCEKQSENLKACTACNQISYCNTDCQKQHWKQHKKTCTYKTKKQVQREELQQAFQSNPSSQSFQQFQKEFEEKNSLKPSKYTELFAQRIKERLEKTPCEIAYETVMDEAEDTGHRVLTIESLAKVQSTHGNICQQELIDVELENRKIRRQILLNEDIKDSQMYQDYSQQIVNLFMEKDIILKSAQEQTLKAIGIEVQEIEKALKVHGKAGKQREIQEIMGKLMQEQKAVLKSKNPISDVNKIQEVFDYQKSLIEKEEKLFLQFISTVSMPLQQMQDIVPFIISSLLLDKTHQKFEIEEEDFFDFLKVQTNWNDNLAKAEESINNGTYKIISNYLQSKLKLKK